MKNRLFVFVSVLILAVCVVGNVAARDDDHKPNNGNKREPQTASPQQPKPQSDNQKPQASISNQKGAALKDNDTEVKPNAEIKANSTEAKANNTEVRSSNTDGKVNNSENKDMDWAEIAWYLLGWAVIIIPILVFVGGLSWLVSRFVKETRNEFSRLRTGLSDARTKSNTLSEKLESMGQAVTGLSHQVTQQKAEISRLKQSAADQPTGSYQPPPPPIVDYPKEPPPFPVPVTDYLAKFGGGANMVKYDYKEGILVSDPTGEGGMAIVQDGGQSLLVPSFGFFQTKSDYATYFERYFSCAKPSGGNVWIRQPAVVSKVDGGWAVTQNGELEVR